MILTQNQDILMMFSIYVINRDCRLHRENTALSAEVLRWNLTIQNRND